MYQNIDNVLKMYANLIEFWKGSFYLLKSLVSAMRPSKTCLPRKTGLENTFSVDKKFLKFGSINSCRWLCSITSCLIQVKRENKLCSWLFFCSWL